MKEGDTALLAKCYFGQNSCAEVGGGIGLDKSDATLHNIYFYGNEAASGGAIVNDSGSPELLNVVFVANTAVENGAGMLNSSGSPSLVNCTWNANIAGALAGGWYNTAGSPSLENCILWGNSDGDPDDFDQIRVVAGSPTVTYSIVQKGWGGAGGAGNLDLDPLFVEEGHDLRLLEGSPAVDVGNNSAVPADVADLDSDGDTTEPVQLDVDSVGRFLNDPDRLDSGVGTPPIVDMGAYEFRSDCNENGIPDDLDIILTPGSDCNANGILDICEIDPEGGAPGGPYFCNLDCDPDCNLNGIPDECDISSSTSQDADADGVPDECVEWNGGGGDHLWSTRHREDGCRVRGEPRLR